MYMYLIKYTMYAESLFFVVFCNHIKQDHMRVLNEVYSVKKVQITYVMDKAVLLHRFVSLAFKIRYSVLTSFSN